MILSIFLLIFIVLVLALLISFVFYVLEPSINEKNNNFENLLVSLNDASDFYAEQKRKIIVSDKKAVVLKQNKKQIRNQPIDFNRQYTCAMVKSIYFTDPGYKFVCLGLGDCVQVCEQKAIVMNDHVAEVTQSCCGCGKCSLVCPQKIIKMVPKNLTDLGRGIKAGSELEKEFEDNLIEKNIERKTKKYFKLWAYCYKIYKIIKVNFN